MVALLPTRQATDLVSGIQDYLTTTFALSDKPAQTAVREFLSDRDNGMFKGPYIRLRLPFQPAQDGWENFLGHQFGEFTPYGHQALAYERLSSLGRYGQRFRRPEPTLVTTGTGSGKTEAFLHPILDHVLRAKREGITGMKALILYPMNALANDQASRLAQLLTTDTRLSGIRAALYTGQKDKDRSRVTSDSLITNPQAIQDHTPDILLTNYKMLDQLLLRHNDAPIWEASALSLQYLVLDEFHTYDGAQGTDVAMLLRRLGITLKSYWPEPSDGGAAVVTAEDRKRPLGMITPVATSATLGGGDGGKEMLHFAETIFGEKFDQASLITESRMSFAQWRQLSPAGAGLPRGLEELSAYISKTNRVVEANPSEEEILDTILDALFEQPPEHEPHVMLDALRYHPLTEFLVAHTENARDITELAESLFPRLTGEKELVEAAEFVSHILALYSYVRVATGRLALTVETHLWIRELTRIDAKVDTSLEFRWGDDPVVETEELAQGEAPATYLPAVYCRHCGRYGWGAKLAPTKSELIVDPDEIRQASLTHEADFRVLLEGGAEADEAAREGRSYRSTKAIGLRYFHRQKQTLDIKPPEDDDPDLHRGLIIPVLALDGDEVVEQSQNDVCPACFTEDAIRFVGSAVSTLTSVAISTLFGDSDLDRAEKKALVFTDSVQDASHRAGFIQARSRTFTLRSQLRNGFADTGYATMTLAQLVNGVMNVPDVADERFHRFRLIPPDLVERKGFAEFWQERASERDRSRAYTNVQRRLSFDAALELGLSARMGRTLELTGSVVAEADAGSDAKLAAIAQKAWDTTLHILPDTGVPSQEEFLYWARGFLVRMRLRGGIYHDWLRRYIESGGRRYWLWGGRPREQGMQAFPKGRSAPAFPVVGSTLPDSGLDPVASRRSWYNDWTHRTLEVGRDDASVLARKLFELLHEGGILMALKAEPGATAYALAPEQVMLAVPSDAGLRNGEHAVQCSVCGTMSFGTPLVVEQLLGAPCLRQTCKGFQERGVFDPKNYYRQLYASTDGKRVVAKEHTSVLKDKDRLAYEDGFKKTLQDPGDPNVLVATPTLEMGIDIGDLSCVMLASLPTSVASYVQRVGRAGRLTGNALVVAFVQGRGEHLPKLNDPLSVIDGEVRPPKTYLDAEEILMRQFMAFLGDKLARDADAAHPQQAKEVMQSVKPNTYFGQLIALAQSDDRALVDEFLHAFGSLVSESSQQRLYAWVQHEMAGILEHETVEWQQLGEALRHRIRDVQDALEDLTQDFHQAQHDFGHDEKHPKLKEAERDVNSATAQLKRLRAEENELNTGWWIAQLERHGIYPNYTLIGEPVVLNVGVSWRDEDTQEFETETYELERMADVAIRELAPGATFYAYGMEIDIDAVDLGPQNRNLQYWQICPGCGWINAIEHTGTERGYSGLVSSCARCDSNAIHDQGQIYTTLELSRVSAEVRRDEASISDNRDSRRRTRFTVVPVNDVEPNGVDTRWFVAENGFGVEYLRQTTVTNLNFGLTSRRSTVRDIAGQRIANAPLFTICAYCGQLRRAEQDHSKYDHRLWCRYRKADEAPEEEVLLAHRLRTQGVKLHLPLQPEYADDYVAPTLLAAVQLGLVEHLGGATGQVAAFELPDHDTMHAMTLLIHDRVPGGTGYLAAFKEPQTVFEVLKAAWEIVSQCPCQQEERRACHRCLLPYAPYKMEDHVARVTAERLLTELLAVPDGASDVQSMPWTIQNDPVECDAGESMLEVEFREALKQRLDSQGVKWESVPTARGEELRFRIPDKRSSGRLHSWSLRPQVDIEGTRPDFKLISGDANLPSLAIYTDGFTYHATPGYNRVGDDAMKRHRLRMQGDALPWAITYQDIELFLVNREHSNTAVRANAWLNQNTVQALQQQHAFQKDIVESIPRGNLELLWQWIQDPDISQWQHIANLAGALALSDSAAQGSIEQEHASEFQLTAEQANTHLNTAQGEYLHWMRQLGAVNMLVRGDLRNPLTMRSILVLHDGSDAMHAYDYKHAWQQWLTWSNMLAFVSDPGSVLIATQSTAQTLWEELYGASDVLVTEAPGIDVARPAVPVGWEIVFEEAEADEHAFFQELAEHGLPVPEIGDEMDGVMLQVSWPDHKVAVVYDPEDIEPVQSKGWTAVVTDDTAAVLVALGQD